MKINNFVKNYWVWNCKLVEILKIFLIFPLRPLSLLLRQTWTIAIYSNKDFRVYNSFSYRNNYNASSVSYCIFLLSFGISRYWAIQNNATFEFQFGKQMFQNSCQMSKIGSKVMSHKENNSRRKAVLFALHI